MPAWLMFLFVRNYRRDALWPLRSKRPRRQNGCAGRQKTGARPLSRCSASLWHAHGI